MALASPPPFRDCLPKLHEFNGIVDSQFAEATARSQLLAWLAQFVADHDAAAQAESERQQRRTKYFLEDVFAGDNGSLLDSTSPPNDCLWAHYFNYENRLRGNYSSGVPAHVRTGHYYIEERDANDPSHRVRTAVPCYTAGSGEINIRAWTPVELTPSEPDANLRPQPPLPPEQLGRQYSLPEIARGLASLHDVDGGFEPFIPTGHELDDWSWTGAKIALGRIWVPDDNWVASLMPLRERLFAAIDHDVQRMKSQPKRGAKVKHDAKVDTKLAGDWVAAKSSGTYQADFAREKGMTLADLKKALTRVRERKSRAQ